MVTRFILSCTVEFEKPSPCGCISSRQQHYGRLREAERVCIWMRAGELEDSAMIDYFSVGVGRHYDVLYRTRSDSS